MLGTCVRNRRIIRIFSTQHLLNTIRTSAWYYNWSADADLATCNKCSKWSKAACNAGPAPSHPGSPSPLAKVGVGVVALWIACKKSKKNLPVSSEYTVKVCGKSSGLGRLCPPAAGQKLVSSSYYLCAHEDINSKKLKQYREIYR